MTTDTDRERVIDARVQRRLATDSAYRNAENAEEQQQREDEITAQEEQRFGAYLDDVAPLEQPNPLEEYGASVRAEEKPPTVAEIIGADLEQRAELLELADLAVRFLAPSVDQATRRLERMNARPTRSHKIDDARAELEEATRALELARKHSPTRTAILKKFA